MRALGIASSSGGTGGAPAVTITGTTAVGSVLTASITAGYGGTLTYQWVRGADGASDLTGASNISGATSSTYTLVSGDIGRVIGCLVSGLTYQGRTSGVIAGIAPSVTTAPEIVGTPEVGAAASYTTGTYTGTTPITKAVQWLLDGAVIVGETGATYTPIEADEGKSLAILETASNAWGSVASTSSGAVIAAAGAGGAEPLPIAGEYIQPWTYADGTQLISLPGWATYDAAGVTTTHEKIAYAQVKDNTLASSPKDFGGVLSHLRDVGSVNQAVRFKIAGFFDDASSTPTNDGKMRVIFGATDHNNSLYFDAFRSESRISFVKIYQRIAGVEAEVGSSTPIVVTDFARDITSGDTIEVRLRGSVVHLFCNGVLLSPPEGWTTSGYTPGMLAGFCSNCWNTRLDDYYAAPLTTASVSVASSLSFWPSSDTGRLVTVTGTTTGAPTALQTRVISAVDHSEVVPWTTNASATFGAGTFAVSVFEPIGNLTNRARYITQVRPIEDVNGWSPGNAHAVGPVFLFYGQSESSARDGAGVTVTGATNSYIVRAGDGVRNASANPWARGGGSDIGGLYQFSKTVSNLLGSPAGVICLGFAAQSLENLKPGGSISTTGDWSPSTPIPLWQHVTTACQRTGATGFVRQLIWTQGVAEANAYAYPDESAYRADFATIAAAFRSTLAISPAAPIGMAVLGIFDGLYEEAPHPDENWAIMRSLQFGMPDHISNCYVSSGLTHIPTSAPADLHPSPAGVTELNRRDAQTAAKLMGVSTYDGRGPIITGGTRSAAVITMAVNLNGAASIAGSSVTGFDVSADNFATLLTISSVNVSGGNVVITLAADPGTAVKVRSYWGYRPTQSSVITGTYSDGTTIQAEPIYNPITVS